VVIETSLGQQIGGQSISPSIYTLTVTPSASDAIEAQDGAAPRKKPGQRGPAGYPGMGGSSALTSPDMGPRAKAIDD
jgi:hypothetical protein